MIYKKLLPIPIILLAISIAVLAAGFLQTGEWFLRSAELKGGTIITINNPGDYNIQEISAALAPLGADSVREIGGLSGNSLSIEIGEDGDADGILNALSSGGINTEDSSVYTIGSSLGESFWAQAQIAVMAAFILMSLAVFAIFRSFVPSLTVILAAASDIIITLAVMQVLGIELSFASLAAIFTLIGYSVDTDVLLTTKVLRGIGTLKERINASIRTGLTMSLTTIAALSAVMLMSISAVLSQIAAVLLIGLLVDIINTWIQNTAILAWHVERRGLNA